MAKEFVVTTQRTHMGAVMYFRWEKVFAWWGVRVEDCNPKNRAWFLAVWRAKMPSGYCRYRIFKPEAGSESEPRVLLTSR